jgi:predicted transcriptional regulator
MLKALKKSIARPDKSSTPDMEKEKEPVSVLMNEKRQKILQLLFRYPCTHLHGIARNFGFSINATRWHIRKLLNFGYLDEFKLGNRTIYYPNKSLNEEDIRILGLLNDKRLEYVFMEIIHTPGITQKEIYEQLEIKQSTMVERLSLLQENQLIYSQRDGLYRRYYPTKVITTREKQSRKSLKEYRKFLIQILEKDGVEPEILRTTDKKFHIRIKSGKSKSDLIFYFNPYERFIE